MIDGSCLRKRRQLLIIINLFPPLQKQGRFFLLRRFQFHIRRARQFLAEHDFRVLAFHGHDHLAYVGNGHLCLLQTPPCYYFGEKKEKYTKKKGKATLSMDL